MLTNKSTWNIRANGGIGRCGPNASQLEPTSEMSAVSTRRVVRNATDLTRAKYRTRFNCTTLKPSLNVFLAHQFEIASSNMVEHGRLIIATTNRWLIRCVVRTVSFFLLFGRFWQLTQMLKLRDKIAARTHARLFRLFLFSFIRFWHFRLQSAHAV